MQIKSESVYYLIEGEPYLSIARAYVNEYQAAHKRVCDYLDNIGINQWRYGFSGHIGGVVIEDDNKIFTQFTKPGRHGVCRPKKTSKYFKEFYTDNLKLPDVVKWVSDKFYIPTNISYKYSGCTGGGSIGHPFLPIEICWFSTDDNAPLMLKIPDVKSKIKQMKAAHPGVTFENNLESWNLDETGLREILSEEWDLMAAKYKKEKEND